MTEELVQTERGAAVIETGPVPDGVTLADVEDEYALPALEVSGV